MDADKFVAIANQVNEASAAKQSELDEGKLRQFSFCCAGDICPMSAVIGGLAAQEVLKVNDLSWCVFHIIKVFCVFATQCID